MFDTRFCELYHASDALHSLSVEIVRHGNESGKQQVGPLIRGSISMSLTQVQLSKAFALPKGREQKPE